MKQDKAEGSNREGVKIWQDLVEKTQKNGDSATERWCARLTQGLPNLGNTCYIAVFAQLGRVVPAIMRRFLKYACWEEFVEDVRSLPRFQGGAIEHDTVELYEVLRDKWSERSFRDLFEIFLKAFFRS